MLPRLQSGDGLYQVSLIMTHRDRAGDRSGQWAGRREAAGPAGHRQGFPTPSRAPAAGSPARPERRLPKAFGLRIAFRWGARLPMSRIAAPRACSPKALGSRLYGSLSALLGISWRHTTGRSFSSRPSETAGREFSARLSSRPSSNSLFMIPGPLFFPDTLFFTECSFIKQSNRKCLNSPGTRSLTGSI